MNPEEQECRRMAPAGRQGEAEQASKRREGQCAPSGVPFLSHLGSLVLLGVSLFSAGCGLSRQQVDQALKPHPGAAGRSAGTAGRYMVGCPDVLMVEVAGKSNVLERLSVGPDGRIDLGILGRPRVEGRSLAEVARDVAELAGVAPEAVRVEVVEYNSQQVYLYGEVAGLQRAVAFRGEETVADLLQRAGGITPGAAPHRVHLVRPRVVEGRPPLIYHVDLEAIVNDREQGSNVLIQPFDQIYVAETRKSSLEKCVPPLLRPLYGTLCGLRRPRKDPAAPETNLLPD